MMQLGLTIPLQKHLKMKVLPCAVPLARRFCWDLHQISLHGCSCLLAVHCSSRYAFTLFDLNAAEWGKLPGCFIGGLRESFMVAGLSASQIEGYLYEAGQLVLTKTHGRREVAFLNRAWDDVVALDYTIDRAHHSQPLLDSAVNALPRRCAGHEGLGRGYQRLRLDLSEEGA